MKWLIFYYLILQGIFTSSSDYLRRATDGRVYFARVEIIVPPNWDTASCGRSLPVGAYTSRGTVNDAAIRIGTEHPIFGSQPWTQQSKGCGLSGDYISMGYHYILQFNETENSIGGSSGNTGRESGGDIDANENGNDSENGYGPSRGYTYGSNAANPTPTGKTLSF